MTTRVLSVMEQVLIEKLDLETTEFDMTMENITEKDYEYLTSHLDVVILPVSEKTLDILAKHPENNIYSKGSNWIAASINFNTYNELANVNQFPCFDHYFNINHFRN